MEIPRRMWSIARKFAESVLPGILKPLRILWNEIIAFFFFVLAVMAVPSTIKAIRSFNGELDVLGRILLTGTFALVMAGYGVYSFLRARKIGKS